MDQQERAVQPSDDDSTVEMQDSPVECQPEQESSTEAEAETRERVRIDSEIAFYVGAAGYDPGPNTEESTDDELAALEAPRMPRMETPPGGGVQAEAKRGGSPMPGDWGIPPPQPPRRGGAEPAKRVQLPR
jgi:hypothetical protein